MTHATNAGASITKDVVSTLGNAQFQGFRFDLIMVSTLST